MSIWDELDQQEKQQSQQQDEFRALVSIDPWPCALVKGVGKVPWDDNAHAGLQRHIAITIVAATDSAEFRREFLSFDRGWRQTRASLDAAGLQPQDFERPRPALIRLAPVIGADGTPETFVARDGTTKTRTTIEIVRALGDDAPDPAPPRTPHPAQPPRILDEPQSARERVALMMIQAMAEERDYQNVASDDAEIDAQAQRLYNETQSLRQKSAVAAVSDERWLALCRMAVESLNPLF